jgi:hypothetical protein
MSTGNLVCPQRRDGQYRGGLGPDSQCRDHKNGSAAEKSEQDKPMFIEGFHGIFNLVLRFFEANERQTSDNGVNNGKIFERIFHRRRNCFHENPPKKRPGGQGEMSFGIPNL